MLYSTRDAKKSEDTLRRLNQHLQKTLREANGRTLGISLLLEGRVKIEGVLVELTSLLSVKALAKQLLRRGQRLDVLIWNAGIGGWIGRNWPLAIWKVNTDLVQATTYPTFQISEVGAVTKPQSDRKRDDDNTSSADFEPELGQVFTANVFGHYMLTHWLSPLLDAQSRVVWISSVAAHNDKFSLEDLQGIRTRDPYDSSKRLTDLFVLTSELPSTQPYVNTFLQGAASQDVAQKPKMYTTHPGILMTSISGLPWFFNFFIELTFMFARWIGSPWHPVSNYAGAVSAVHVALSPHIPEQEQREGKGKWGSATSVFGDERVGRTEVEGWGFTGVPGDVPSGSVTAKIGRYRDLKDTDDRLRQDFEESGRQAWKEMEQLRHEWEERLGPVDANDSEDV